MHLYLIRHGQSYINLPGWTGSHDAGLTDLGQRQAERAAAWVAEHVQATVLYASTMRRAQETAARISACTGLPITPDDRLREVGHCFPDASPVPLEPEPPIYADYWATQRPFSPTFARGETWLHTLARVGGFIDDVVARHTAPDDVVLAVCHGGVMNAAMDIFFGAGPWRRVELWVKNTGISHLEYLDGAALEYWRLHEINMYYHLMNGDGKLIE